jgi:hypothetical protein
MDMVVCVWWDLLVGVVWCGEGLEVLCGWGWGLDGGGQARRYVYSHSPRLKATYTGQ